ncbi:MAG: endo-alpha-N-acetylgalactosaminidase family protein, partial [Flavobacterium sp.]
MKYFFALSISLISLCGSAQQKKPAEISGAWYDWTKTLKPEKPWILDYSQTVVMKLFLCSRDSVGNVKHVYLDFAGALNEIKKIDQLTLGIPKIVYLVGWQFTGHDAGYPSWAVVNERLKRPQDSTALQSLHWLIKEAKKYHTVVSLHINMIDAYKNSPLWNTYLGKNIIIKNKNGEPIPGEIFDGMQSYQISYARE